MPDSSAEDVPASASRQTDGLHIRWQGQPHRTYHLLQTDQLNSSTEWLSIGAAVAEAEGKFSLTSPGEKSHSFWRAVQVQ